MPLAQVVEHLADVEVLLHRGAEQLEAGVAGELLDLVAESAKRRVIYLLQQRGSGKRVKKGEHSAICRDKRARAHLFSA